MTQLGIWIAWLVLSPLALVTNVIAIVIVCHYRGQFHGTDVAFISLFVTMMVEAVAVVPVPAVLGVVGEDWRWPQLCSSYVWLVLCVRMSHLLVTLIVNVHWMCILRFTSGQEVYSSTTAVKVFVVLAWVAAVVTGIVPVVGNSFYSYYQEIASKELVPGEGGDPARLVTTVRRECHYLPEGLGMSFIIFFIFLTLAVLVLSLVASSDTLTVFHYMKKTAVHKYKAGRFYLPSSALLDTAVNKNADPQAANPHAPAHHHHHSDTEQSLNKTEEIRDDDGTTRSLQNNGDVPVGIHRNGKIPGEEERGAHNAAFTEDEVTITPSSGGNVPTAGGMSGNGHSSSLQGNGASPGGAAAAPPPRGRLVRSAATVVVRPSEKSGVAKTNPPTVHARYNELNLSAELCRVVFCFTLLAALINHLPFVVLQFVQLVQEVDREDAEVTVLWLTLAHCLTLPHLLWILSRRYRHALSYTWTVHILRDESAKEEDPASCTLQSYTRKVVSPEGGTMKVMARSRGREPITMTTNEGSGVTERQANGSAVRDGAPSQSSPAVQGTWGQGTDTEEPLPPLSGHGSRTEVMTTDLDDGMTIVTNLASHQVTYIYNAPPDQPPNSPSSEYRDDERKLSEDLSDSSELIGGHQDGSVLVHSPTHRDVPPKDRRNSSVRSEGRANSYASSSATASPSRSSLGTPTRGSTDISRSSSARQVWKEQMMKKHLPAIFINEAFEPDEDIQEEPVDGEVRLLPDVTQVTEKARVQTSSDDKRKAKDPHFHYYMSGNFHHDYLRSDSLPRMESESDGGSFQYDDNDIEGILDREHSLRSQRVAPSMSTFLGNSGENAPDKDATDVETAPPNPRDGTGAASDGGTAVVGSGEWPVSDSRKQSEDIESQPQSRTPGHRKPRRSAAILKDSRRPSLQHQNSLHADPEMSTEDVSAEREVDNRHFSEASAQNVPDDPTQKTFYPRFESMDGDPEVLPTSGVREGLEETDGNGSISEKQPSNLVLTNTHKTENKPEHNDTQAVDTNDVFINIDHVTTDASHTDAVGDTDRSFMPQGQASVLGILLEDGTELPTHTTTPDNISTRTHPPLFPSHTHVQEMDEFDNISDFRACPSPFNPFSENDHEQVASSQTNPFFDDFSRDKQTSAGLELSPMTPHHYPVSTQADSLPSLEDGVGFFRDTHTTHFPEEPFRPAPCDVGADEGLAVTHTSSDRAVPDTACTGDAEETTSLNSEPSVVLEPYNVDRRPPWMDSEFEDSGPVSPKKKSRNPFRASFDADDPEALGSSGDFGSSFGSNSEIRTIFSDQNRGDFGNPFSYDSFSDKFADDGDSDFQQSSVDSGQAFGVDHNGSSMFQSYPYFDEETDRGFEDALALENVIGVGPFYGHFSRRFESIEEEPEDYTESAHTAEKESHQESTPADVPHDSSMDNNSSAQLAETNPFEQMNGNSSLPSTSSDPSPVFSSTNPFSPHTSPQRSVFFGEQTASLSDPVPAPLHPQLFDKEPVHLNGGESSTSIADTPTEEPTPTTTPPPAPRIRLTKPIPWKLKDSKPKENGVDSGVPSSSSGVVERKGFRGRTHSDEKTSREFDAGVSPKNGTDVSVCSEGGGGGGNGDQDGFRAQKPPVPPRPSKEGKVDLQGDPSAVNQFDPVFF